MKFCMALLFALNLMAANDVFAAAFKTQTWRTKNGANVVFYQAMEVPILDVHIAFAAGSAYDGSKFGLSALTTRLLDQGNKGLSAGDVADQFAEIGAQYGGSNSQDMMMLSLRTLTDPNILDKACRLFSLLIAHPDFPASSFEREKNQQLIDLARRQDTLDVVANDVFFQALYGRHPYAHPVDGSIETVKTLNLEDVRRFYKQYVVGSNATIVIVGAIDKIKAEHIANQLIQDLPKGRIAQSIPTARALAAEKNIIVPHTSSQNALRIGQLGINHHDPQYFPLQVGSYILGGGSLVSRLSHELREMRGLTYGVSSQFLPMPGLGPFLLSFSTQNNQTNLASELTRDVLTNFIKNGPTEQELIEAKQYLTGSFPWSLASNRNIADILLKMSFYGLPSDYLTTYLDNVNAVQSNEIKRAFQDKINPNTLLQVTAGSV